MNPLMEKLHDIEGLDPISAWPLAIGWWILIAIGIIIFVAIICFVAVRIAFKRSWKSDTFDKLASLEQNLSDETGRETLMALSEYIRRIALRRYSRNECAGLSGQAWLQWLTQNDPKNFDWEKHGTLMIEVPYAPVDKRLPAHQIKELIQAVRNWVR